MISLISVIISLVLAASIHIVLAVSLCVILPFQVISYHWINQKLAFYCQELQEVSSHGHTGIIDIVQNIESIKQLNDPKCFAGLVGNKITLTQNCMYKVNRFANIASSFSEYLIDLFNGFALFYAIYLCYNQQISLAQLFLFYQIRSIYSEEIRKIVRVNINLRDLKPSVDFVNEKILKHMETDEGIVLENIHQLKVEVKSFGFSKEKRILQNVCFELCPGQHIGLSAASGKGKSTLMKMIARLYENHQIYINGMAIHQWTYTSIRDKIYYLSQNTELFPGTIRDNLLYGLDESEYIRLEKVSEYRFFQPILQMQDGLDTVIQEHASNLSGGQKQMIALARLLMHSPDLIIFDESFASIDESTEKMIFEDIQDYLSDKMVIIISHRPSSFNYCEQMIFI